MEKNVQTKIKKIQHSCEQPSPNDDGDQNEEKQQTIKAQKVKDASLEVPTKETNLPSKVSIEDNNARFSPLRMEVIKEVM